jgi:NADH-quinone oxidoreductase subunit C
MTPKERLDQLADLLKERFGESGCSVEPGFHELNLIVPRDQWADVARQLRDDADLSFEQAMDLSGVDYAGFGKAEWATHEASASGFGRGLVKDELEEGDGKGRYAVAYQLLSVKHNNRLRVKVYLDSEDPRVDSMISIWSGVDWFEREAFDMYGILFDGHPDLRRILTDYGFIGHPLRKDFPLIGQVEMEYDEQQQRVVYQPVSIEQRDQVPKVIRDDANPIGENADA